MRLRLLALPLIPMLLAGCSGGGRTLTIHAENMRPTLQVGDRVKVAIGPGRSVTRGAIVVFVGPQPWQANFELSGSKKPLEFISRVVAVGGDTISCRNAQLFVNNKRAVENYLSPGSQQCADDGFEGQSVTVPPGRFFVMGDNRGGSADSRAHLSEDDGTIPDGNVTGVVTAILSPKSRARKV